MTSEGTLNLLCQKCGIKQPNYQTKRSSEGGFVCSVKIGGRSFETQARAGHTTKRAAEEEAARAALEAVLADNPCGASDAGGLLQWLEGEGRRSTWKPFQVSYCIMFAFSHVGYIGRHFLISRLALPRKVMRLHKVLLLKS